MKKQLLPKAPSIKDFTGMNIASSIMFHKEALKRETDLEKKDFHQKKLNLLRVELENYIANKLV
ncbi:hypothetical protein [Clostridium estertheticum]|uniref:Uncharacterized protein n=1 Tax=Clostridium estertheticum TaxID=238834 RepID=A0AA47I7Y0_9CLOT|nr:hypothetical protein [Clostridium estertheticum]MBU3153477.1 hypothetical protein [Clostridium estertheticum]WAG60879.1 hypothetical protein LL038_01105 [Clostridium estertheticum]